jgi:sortase (surface protein transpeptidase)
VRRLLVAVLLGAALVGCSATEPSAPPSGVAASLAASAEDPQSLPVPQPRPVKVEVPSVDISGEVMLNGLGLDASGGHAEPPVDQPMLASWYNPGPRPGERGPAVILGHVNGGGQQGIFARLHQVQMGDRIFVTREDGSKIAFEAYRVEKEIDKTKFPANEVYGKVDGSEIRLITCGGELDRKAHRYLSNVIVWARLTDATPA